MRLLAGFDGGGTKTLCALATPEGEVVSLGTGGPSNLCTHASSTRDSVVAAFQEAAHPLGALPQVSVACLALAGFHACAVPGGPEAAFVGALPASDLVVIPDMEAAFLGAAGGEPAVVVIAGTGTAVYGGGSRGQRARAAGWGYLLDDEGSGFWIGLEALKAALKEFDGRGDATGLTSALLQHLGLPDVEAIEGYPFGLKDLTTSVASLAPLVFDLASKGDQVAASILRQAGAHLSVPVSAVLRRLGLQDAPVCVACVGSVLTAQGSPVREALRGRLAELAPKATLTLPLLPPVGGALLAAAKAAGHPVSPSFLARMKESLERQES
ncbi:MAG TPA: BadF/BadG/BcrA/BcrD ATPase family protein [Armatimonadota bacterium]|jgi:N-acetylglucosamine kinase-like BadF-type ATPase